MRLGWRLEAGRLKSFGGGCSGTMTVVCVSAIGSSMQDFIKLRVWNAAHSVRLRIHAVTKPFPSDERYGLSSQIRRSSASICANIAESRGYRGKADSARFIRIALGSASETHNHLLAARDLGYLAPEITGVLEKELGAVRAMLLKLLARMS